MSNDIPVDLLGCGIFAREFGLLPPVLTSRFRPHFLDSMLHMRPPALEAALSARLEGQTGPWAILYGDCCPHMEELSGEAGRCRTRGCNCIEIALGSRRYRELRRERSFFFMPEWVGRWEEIFAFELGLGDPELARSLMQDEMSRIVYVDTGLAKPPEEELERIGRHFGLPASIEAAGTRGLAQALEAVLGGLDVVGGPSLEDSDG